MEHNRPNGLAQGYYCSNCGVAGMSMYTPGHGPGKCEYNPDLVRILQYLNSDPMGADTPTMQSKCRHEWRGYNGDQNGNPIKFQFHPLNKQLWQQCINCGKREQLTETEPAKDNEMAKYDQGGGCPCGLYRECECDMAEVRDPRQLEMVWDARDALTERGVERTANWGPKVGQGLSLGDKLKATLDALEAANLKTLQEKAAADVAKIERERADIAHFVEGIKNSMVQNIERGKVPLLKIKTHERMKWLEAAVKGKAPHQFYWNEMVAWFSKEKLRVEVIPDHDGMGMESWLNVTVTPSEKVITYRTGGHR